MGKIMTDYIIIGLLLIQMLPKVRFVSDHKGIRITVFYTKKYYSDPDSLMEGYFEVTNCFWLKKNKEWWDLLKKD
jgi:hypothetical protein